MTADELLRVKRPEDLFSGDLATAKTQYRKLAQDWHPDKRGGKDTNGTFAHLSALYEEAVRRIENGLWEGPSTLRLALKRAPDLVLPYYANTPCEVGRLFVGDEHLTYVVEPAHRALFKNAEAMTGIFTYANDKMRAEVSRYLPANVKRHETADGRFVMSIPKTPDLLLLRDVIAHFGGAMPPRHAAWIQSTLCNIACYLAYAGIVHHNIGPDTYFVSPEYHSGALLGGWWYAAKIGTPLAQVPQRTYDFLPWEVRSSKVASYLTDQELIRTTGREVLGDADGLKLADAPQPMIDWLKSVATGTAVENYEQWGEALTRAYGPRKFVKLDLNASMLYRAT